MPPNRAESTHFGFRSVPLDDKQALVDDVFHTVARRYDLMNDLMSGGLHRAWKDALVTAVNPPQAPTAAGGLSRCSTSPAAPATSPSGWSRRAAPAPHATVADINADMLGGRPRARRRARARRRRHLRRGQRRGAAVSRPQLRCRHHRVRHPQRAAHRGGARRSTSRAAASAGTSSAWNSPRSTCRASTRCTTSTPSTSIPALGRAVAGDAEAYRYLVEFDPPFPAARTISPR